MLQQGGVVRLLKPALGFAQIKRRTAVTRLKTAASDKVGRTALEINSNLSGIRTITGRSCRKKSYTIMVRFEKRIRVSF